MSELQPIVEIQNLTKRYGDFVAIDDLSLTVHRGQILGFIGPNGAGKTTTIKILVGLAKPTSGTARIAGVDCAKQSSTIKRLVGYMPDGFGAYDNMRVREYLDFFGAAFGIPRRQRQRRIAEVLEITSSTYMQDRFVESLSHGMQQRVGIARTLLHDPEVLIFDEPANGLDPQARIEMRELLLHLAACDKTLIVTSHILPELSRICDQVAILTHGRLRAAGSLEQIMHDLSQRRMIEIQLLAGEPPDQAKQVLQTILQADEPVTVSQAESMVRFETLRSDDALSEVLGKLIQAGVKIAQFRELQADLEDAFLSVIRQTEESQESPLPASTPSR
ncbi:putative ABC transporter ATP-binding protein YxlF [Roseimaritima multifibrata]|uniref:Putative ABC transporter ATP-binding protein YxlF n=1 Tax=Roseimaritima multifibrata TaxID=1930274 RepID=A0A517MC52_9BACT|nr:ABC transporter ATP-binding protein [Roseimaritima multifibrata]QDS92451.1 putative ABC transporter ATP-binding protein YxlF [Roseimaritima multifibrata]